MKHLSEKNIEEFNNDVKTTGRYQYTNFEKYSAFIATKRQSEEIYKLLESQQGKKLSILDVGCGDGTFTLEILETIKPKRIVGFDSARSAIKSANKRVTIKQKKKIVFKYCNVYNAHRVFTKEKFDIIVVRGVLHHLYKPEDAIKSLCAVSNKIIVLEPNGYNPILKIIEKVSPYHIKHEERSYWPPTLNKWFIANNFKVKKQIFCGIVPYFCPTVVAKSLKTMEPLMEKLPLKFFYCGTNVIYYEKNKGK